MLCGCDVYGSSSEHVLIRRGLTGLFVELPQTEVRPAQAGQAWVCEVWTTADGLKPVWLKVRMAKPLGSKVPKSNAGLSGTDGESWRRFVIEQTLEGLRFAR